MSGFDVAIVGAGIAGASLAAMLSPHRSVLLLEAEDRPGYHSTGRSAAFWSESYGGPGIQPLTTASFDALSDGGFLTPRGALHLAEADDSAAAERFFGEFDGSGVRLERLGRGAIERLSACYPARLGGGGVGTRLPRHRRRRPACALSAGGKGGWRGAAMPCRSAPSVMERWPLVD